MPVEPLQKFRENAFADIGAARETFVPTLSAREVGHITIVVTQTLVTLLSELVYVRVNTRLGDPDPVVPQTSS